MGTDCPKALLAQQVLTRAFNSICHDRHKNMSLIGDQIPPGCHSIALKDLLVVLEPDSFCPIHENLQFVISVNAHETKEDLLSKLYLTFLTPVFFLPMATMASSNFSQTLGTAKKYVGLTSRSVLIRLPLRASLSAK